MLKTSKVIILEQTLGIIDQAFYLLSAFIYADIRIAQHKKLLSKFTVGLLILAVGQIFYIDPLLIPAYGILAHIVKISGFALIFAGLGELKSTTELIGFRQKLLAYLSLFLIISYLLFISIASAVFNVQFPLYALYLFLEFLIISIIIQYILAIRFTEPVTNITHVMNRYKVGEKSEQIPVTSEDEVGMLTIKLNEVLDLVWKYNQKLVSKQTQIQQSRDKEKIIKQIVTELKLSESLKQAYNDMLSKITDIFNADRAVFIELPVVGELIPTIKYEYLRSQDVLSIFDARLPEIFTKDFLELFNSLESCQLIVNNADEHYSKDKTAQDFFKKYKVKSFLANLLTRYNGSRKNLGLIVICSSESRIWTQNEIDLLKAIADNVVAIIWEITKLIEIDELRNTFILTLAHDFQVPLVGEQKALEYIISRSPDDPIGKYKEFIEETIKSNRNLYDMLRKLLDIYNYESGRRRLFISECDMSELINEVINQVQDFACLKSVTINIDIQENLPKVKIDKSEIHSVLYCLLENAIVHTKKETQITIKCYQQENSLITCIQDMGTGIPSEAIDKIFKRYPMIQAIERKIGAGLGLYLSKLIVEAHEGEIWFNTEHGVGTTFSFLLPIN